jgi:ribosomal protein S18 acetylase RimI-like enzyme
MTHAETAVERLWRQSGDTALPALAALLHDASAVARVVAGAAAVVVEREPRPGVGSDVWIAAEEVAALERLLETGDWPAAAWHVCRADLCEFLERRLERRRRPERDERMYVAEQVVVQPHPLVRPLAEAEAESLDLAPCGLSATALRHWLWRGWRVFGAVADGRLLCHAIAAYPAGDTEEVAAVFTAPEMRGRGLASAVAGAVAADIVARGRRARYLVRRANTASQRVVEKIGMTAQVTIYQVER